MTPHSGVYPHFTAPVASFTPHSRHRVSGPWQHADVRRAPATPLRAMPEKGIASSDTAVGTTGATASPACVPIDEICRLSGAKQPRQVREGCKPRPAIFPPFHITTRPHERRFPSVDTDYGRGKRKVSFRHIYSFSRMVHNAPLPLLGARTNCGVFREGGGGRSPPGPPYPTGPDSPACCPP